MQIKIFCEAIYKKTLCCSKESLVFSLLIKWLVVFLMIRKASHIAWLSALVICRKCFEKTMYQIIQFQKLCYKSSMFKIFLSLITNCSSQSSFSVLKDIKKYLRSSIGQARPNWVACLFSAATMMFLTYFQWMTLFLTLQP